VKDRVLIDRLGPVALAVLVGDLIGLLDGLEAPTAVIVGHDWGATIAWQAARLRSDRFRAIVDLSVPFRPRSPARPTPDAANG
jgi:pimeloyl-ACP methyl ester carboxylesterase